MNTVTLTANVALRYKLREKPLNRKDDGFLMKAGDAIHITEDALRDFVAVEVKTGKVTTDYHTAAYRSR